MDRQPILFLQVRMFLCVPKGSFAANWIRSQALHYPHLFHIPGPVPAKEASVLSLLSILLLMVLFSRALSVHL